MRSCRIKEMTGFLPQNYDRQQVAGVWPDSPNCFFCPIAHHGPILADIGDEIGIEINLCLMWFDPEHQLLIDGTTVKEILPGGFAVILPGKDDHRLEIDG